MDRKEDTMSHDAISYWQTVDFKGRLLEWVREHGPSTKMFPATFRLWNSLHKGIQLPYWNRDDTVFQPTGVKLHKKFHPWEDLAFCVPYDWFENVEVNKASIRFFPGTVRLKVKATGQEIGWIEPDDRKLLFGDLEVEIQLPEPVLSRQEEYVFQYQDGVSGYYGQDIPVWYFVRDLWQKVMFVQPFGVGEHTVPAEVKSVIILDVAFDGQGYTTTTVPFLNGLGSRMKAWVDHHPHAEWKTMGNDPKFFLFTREEAPAMPPVITPEMVAHIGPVEMIVAHGDLDGILSACKYTMQGYEPYPGADADAVAADTRIGELSERGRRYDAAIKANIKDDKIRLAIFHEVVYDDPEAKKIVDNAVERYATIQRKTVELTDKYIVSGIVAFCDAAGESAFDLTALLMEGQKIAQVAIVSQTWRSGSHEFSVAVPQGTRNLVELFSLKGGAPNVVALPAEKWTLEQIIEKIG